MVRTSSFFKIALTDIDNFFASPQIPESQSMSVVCNHCSALRFSGESPGFCCKAGKVQLPLLESIDETMLEFFTDKQFMKNIRKYNQSLAFCSLGANVDYNLASDRDGVYTFRVHGTIMHKIGDLLPTVGEQPKFMQIYMHDAEEQARIRNRIYNDNLSTNILQRLGEYLSRINPFVTLYRRWSTNSINHSIVYNSDSVDIRRYNAPTESEVGAIIIDNDMSNGSRDLVLRKQSGGLQRIDASYGVYDPLEYPLLFPKGQHGWHTNVRPTQSRRISCLEFACHRLMVRHANLNNAIHLGGRLFQQYVVDQYCKIEGERLTYLRKHQQDIRADVYQGLGDALNNGDERAGRRVILPSSFTGGARDMNQRYHDSMALVAEFGKPDLFITMSANPKWKEVENHLLPGQSSQDRPDIVARVFHEKLKYLKYLIYKKNIFGICKAFVYTIEFQKRGLPHCHMLVFLEESPASAIDQYVSAEVPDPISQPLLFQAVKNFMMHGPCGQLNNKCPCMRDGKCTKNFPKSFVNQTSTDEDSYPLYRRRDTGKKVKKWCRGRQVYLDNRNVVPYNPFLLLVMNCHVNVEVCTTISSVKYIHKYITKGHDRASIRLTTPGDATDNVDEIKNYQDGRYVSASEACWRIFRFEISCMSHTICRLPVHLPNQQYVAFGSNENLQSVMERNTATKLTSFFAVCAQEQEAKELTYRDFPKYYAWNSSLKSWKRRERDCKTIGRMYVASIRDTERFYLRMLLNYVKGPTSYEYLRTFEGIVYPTFKDVCRARGYLNDDTEWDRCLSEASEYRMPSAIRRLFANILVFGNPTNPGDLWAKYSSLLAEGQNGLEGAISQIEKNLSYYNLSLSNYEGISAAVSTPTLLEQEVNMCSNDIYSIPNFNEQQLQVFNDVTDAAMAESENNVFFLNASAGTGKTFLTENIAAYIRSQGKVAIVVASSGIAAQLLTGGTTAHSRFKIPLDLTNTSTCSISVNSQLAHLLQQTSIIIWDEAPMMHKHAFEALDRSLQDICKNKLPFGGITTMLCGDFRQILPVVLKGTPGQTVSACIRQSYLWSKMRIFNLHQNMRVEEDLEFAQYLLKIGDGTVGEIDDLMEVPEDLQTPESTLQSLIESIYPDFNTNCESDGWLGDRVILAPTNKEVNSINDVMSYKLPGQFTSYRSFDSVEEEENVNPSLYQVEFLNSINHLAGIAPHELMLKIGMPVMLLRNLDRELTNGTRMLIQNMSANLIQAKVQHGQNQGKSYLIPRIFMTSIDKSLPFRLRRKQFPFKPCFAMTINKSQGQTLKHVGISLKRDVFTHGQLYVAMSRVTKRENLKILSMGPIKNIVYKQVLL